VPLAKLSSWYLLMLLSFVLVTIINDVRIRDCDEQLQLQLEPIESKID